MNGFFIAGLVVCLFISPGSARADSDLSVKELYRGFVLKAEESVAELGRDILGRKWDLAPGARHIGILTERTTLTSGFAKTFGMNLATGPFPGTLPGRDVPSERPMQQRLNWLVRAVDAAEHYVQYLRFTGQNLHVMGCFQYNERNTPFTPMPRAKLSRISNDLRDVAARVFKANGIDFLASVEYAGHVRLARKHHLPDAQVANCADTARAVSATGKQLTGGRIPAYGCWNFVHSDVQGAMLAVAKDLLTKFSSLDNFKGINWTAYLSGEWLPNFPDPAGINPFNASFDDTTLGLLCKDTRIRLPIDAGDSARFKKRFTALSSAVLRDRFIAWRCKKVYEFFRRVRNMAKSTRSDLHIFVSLYFNVPHARNWSRGEFSQGTQHV